MGRRGGLEGQEVRWRGQRLWVPSSGAEVGLSGRVKIKVLVAPITLNFWLLIIVGIMMMTYLVPVLRIRPTFFLNGGRNDLAQAIVLGWGRGEEKH